MNQQAVETAKATPPLVDMTDEVEKREDGQREDSGAPNEAKPRPTCGECGKKYANARMLDFHKNTHLKYAERPYGCETCGRRYAYPSHLARHRRRKHVGAPTQRQRQVDIRTQPAGDDDLKDEEIEDPAE